MTRSTRLSRFRAGQQIEVLYRGQWQLAEVVQTGSNEIYVRTQEPDPADLLVRRASNLRFLAKL